MALDNTLPQLDVVVAGAGPVGLALALELGLQGRSCLVLERHERVGLAPRAKTTNTRSRELMRRWGVADDLARMTPFGLDYPPNVVFATRLTGHELARFENAFHGRPAHDPRFPEHAQWIPQYKVEEVLRRRAVDLEGVELRFDTEVLGFVDDGAKVRVELKNVSTGATSTVEARFLVGADGARSTVRTALGIPMAGVSPISHHYNIVFRSPGLEHRHALGRAIMYWLINPEVPAVLSPLDRGDLWAFGCEKLRDADADPVQLIRAALGIADLEVEVLSRDVWVAHQLIAEHYRRGNVFLAGDACHLHPPFGGYGMNMGIGDAVDLGWKFGAVLAGWGGPALLDSYEIERRQVHQRVVDEAVLNHRAGSRSFALGNLEADDATGAAARAEAGESIRRGKRREFDSLGIVLGSCHDGSPIIVPDGTPMPAADPLTFEPSARPGGRAPHAWLAETNAHGASLFDRFDRTGLTLLVTRRERQAEATAVAAAAEALGVPLSVLAPELDGLRALYQADFALIRPDQFVAWRGDRIQDACAAIEVAAGRTATA